jgi:hypothetical protein
VSVPTLEELFEKFRKLLDDPEFVSHCEAFEQHFRMVASGEAWPMLKLNNAVLAAQCVTVILEHVKQEAKGGES